MAYLGQTDCLILGVLVFNIICGLSKSIEKRDENTLEEVELGDEIIQKFNEEFRKSKPVVFEDSRTVNVTSERLSNAGCDLAWNMEKKKTMAFKSPNYGKLNKTYPSGFTCYLSFIGSDECRPFITCPTPVDLRRSSGSQCQKEHLLITDGIGGEARLCANMTLRPSVASSLGRDLYAIFRTAKTSQKGRIHKGFRCEVSCLPQYESAQSLSFNAFHHQIIPQCVCGIANAFDRIVGGVSADMHSFPWLVALVSKGTRIPFCGGSVINDRFILTATHCFYQKNRTAENVDILVHANLLSAATTVNAKNVSLGLPGSIRAPGWSKEERSDWDENSQRFSIQRLTVHPLFTKGYDFDIGLIELDRPINFRSLNAPTPVCLPRLGHTSKNYEGEIFTVAGWGKANNKAGSSTRKLQKLESVPAIEPYTVCQNFITKYQITPRMLCAGFLEGDRDACAGDSGGPLMIKESKRLNRYRQHGVVSFGRSCALPNKPGVYSRLANLVQWIYYITETSSPKPKWCKDIYSE